MSLLWLLVAGLALLALLLALSALIGMGPHRHVGGVLQLAASLLPLTVRHSPWR